MTQVVLPNTDQPDDVLTTSRDLRERHADRVEVLDKVKKLALLPGDTWATTEIVASYFEVGIEAIKSAVKAHFDELESDGYKVIEGAALRSFKDLSGMSSRAPSLALFPRRAILRMGMLLRDSTVAKQVRDYLLDAEERAGRDVPDMSTTEGQIEVMTRWLADLKEKRVLELTTAQQARELERARPRADYVDRFVDPKDDCFTVNTVAGQFGVTEPTFRTYLVVRGVIYRRAAGSRWSKSKKKHMPLYEWLAHARYRTWFTVKDQPEAPRLHNGQMRTTMYFNAVGKEGVEQLVRRHPIGEPVPISDDAQ